jgi:CubicO group peptidase (beta-lactamase class C family)
VDLLPGPPDDVLLLLPEKVRLDDEISRYFTDPPSSWKGIHIAHLLSHTSGLPDIVEEDVGGVPFVSYATSSCWPTLRDRARDGDTWSVH